MYRQTLGYPTRTAAVEALVARGLSPEDIAGEIGGTPNSIQCLMNSARRRNTDRKIVLPRALAESLGSEAARRGMTMPELAESLLETIARDDVFEALLGEAPPPPPAVPLPEQAQGGSDG